MIERPAARYGRQRLSRRSRRGIAIGLTLFIVAAGVVIALIGFQRLGSGDVKGELSGYRLVDDETVEVTISVTRKDPLSKSCASCGPVRSTAAKRAGARSWCPRPRSQRCRSRHRQVKQATRGRRRLRLRNRRPDLPARALTTGRRGNDTTNAELRIRENRLTWRWYDRVVHGSQGSRVLLHFRADMRLRSRQHTRLCRRDKREDDDDRSATT